jgi:hypothetical protein
MLLSAWLTYSVTAVQYILMIHICWVYFVLALVNCWAIIRVTEMQPFQWKKALAEYFKIMFAALYIAMTFPKHFGYFLLIAVPSIPFWPIVKTVFSVTVQIPCEMLMLCCCSKRHH